MHQSHFTITCNTEPRQCKNHITNPTSSLLVLYRHSSPCIYDHTSNFSVVINTQHFITRTTGMPCLITVSVYIFPFQHFTHQEHLRTKFPFVSHQMILSSINVPSNSRNKATIFKPTFKCSSMHFSDHHLPLYCPLLKSPRPLPRPLSIIIKGLPPDGPPPRP